MHSAARLLVTLAIGLTLAAAAWGATGRISTLSATTQTLNLRHVVDILDDPSGTLDIAAVRDRAFAMVPAGQGEAINLGYRKGALWLRFALAPERAAPADWLLEVAYPSLDRVDLYLPGPGGMQVLGAGDLQPRVRSYPHHHLVFPVRLTPGTEQVVYLRVETTGNMTVPLTLWQVDALAREDRRVYVRHALYFGALLALLLYNLLLYLSVRDPLYLLYVGMVAGMGIGQLSLNGFGNLWLWPDSAPWGHWALPWGFAFCGLAGAMFTRRFLDTAHYAPRLDRAILATLASFALLASAGPLLPYTWFAIGVSLTGLIFSILAVIVGVKTFLAGSPGARYFLLAWTILLVGVGSMAARNLGWLPSNWLTLNLMQIGSALEMLLLSFALADRINILQRDKTLAQSDAMQAKEQLVATLRRSETELEDRVRQRTEALTQACEKLRESEERMRTLATHDPLTGLANRQLLDEEMDHALARAQRAGTRLGVAFIDLDGFKAVNDRHGHEVGDQVLISVAERLCCQVRAGDIVARLGGDEFVWSWKTSVRAPISSGAPS
ncbi:MAG: diguanylate cyclase [Hydrogenophilales bacterium]|nr:diguanylate cyclase [Hydrogenophilales bacterium]